jgi:hypothetical protein
MASLPPAMGRPPGLPMASSVDLSACRARGGQTHAQGNSKSPRQIPAFSGSVVPPSYSSRNNPPCNAIAHTSGTQALSSPFAGGEGRTRPQQAWVPGAHSGSHWKDVPLPAMPQWPSSGRGVPPPCSCPHAPGLASRYLATLRNPHRLAFIRPLNKLYQIVKSKRHHGSLSPQARADGTWLLREGRKQNLHKPPISQFTRQ